MAHVTGEVIAEKVLRHLELQQWVTASYGRLTLVKGPLFKGMQPSFRIRGAEGISPNAFVPWADNSKEASESWDIDVIGSGPVTDPPILTFTLFQLRWMNGISPVELLKALKLPSGLKSDDEVPQ